MNEALGSYTSDAVDVNQFLVFRLGSELYGVEILKVQEIKGLGAVTKIPHAPDHIRGVTNLRGAVVPILDLRRRFGLPDRPSDRFSVFVIVTVDTRVMGLVVDAVEDVIDLAPEAIQAAPDLAPALGGAYVSGIGQKDGRLVAILDIDKVVEADLFVAANG